MLVFDEILQYALSSFAADFGVKLRRIEVIFVQHGTKTQAIVASSDGVGAKVSVIAVYKIYVGVFVETIDEGTAIVKDVVPAYVGYFEVGFSEPLHIYVEYPEARSVILFGMATHELHPHASTQKRLLEGRDNPIEASLSKIGH